ncbi:glycosyltransferase family 2 protein [Brenneria sp. 4F2]|nr:glycosyltransferase family 2 protein [Brenneria bubanii]
MKYSFVILTWNRSPMLKVCLENLVKSIDDKKNSEIIIYDNSSPDDTMLVINDFENKHKNDISIKVIKGAENVGLRAYKELFSLAAGDYIIEVDDDILEFPKSVDSVFFNYLSVFKDYGYLALDVVQNEFTTGAKPSLDKYKIIKKDGMVVEKGPTGGWCTGFRRKDYRKIKFIFDFFDHYNFKHGEDGFLCKLFRLIGKKSGIISGIKCFHATGPHYSKVYGLLDRDIEKYSLSGRKDLVDWYSSKK